MRAPAPIWEMSYTHDHRAHRHRCIRCNRIVNAGERVCMAKTGVKKTKVVHVEGCADQVADSLSWRNRLELWGREYLKACGWSQKSIDAAVQKAA